jgi:transcriptional regulator with XRE-family HTH domain
MKKKTNLGAVIKEARESLGLTQRRLAAKVGVKASHIAYIEGNRRRPSLPLVRNLAVVLGLDRREMLFLSYPDAKFLIDDATRSGAAKPENDAWGQFTSNRAMLKRHGITRGELKVLKEVSLLEHVSSPRHFLFVLNAIRQAGER